MKLKRVIKEIEKNGEATVTIDKDRYIALLRELNRLRFKCSHRGASAGNKKAPANDDAEPEAVMM